MLYLCTGIRFYEQSEWGISKGMGASQIIFVADTFVFDVI